MCELNLTAGDIHRYTLCPARFHRARTDGSSHTVDEFVDDLVRSAMLGFFCLPPARRDVDEAHGLLRGMWRRDRRRSALFPDPVTEREAGGLALSMMAQLCQHSRLSGQPFVVGQPVRTVLLPGADLVGFIHTAELGAKGGVRIAQYPPRALVGPEESSFEALILSLGILNRYRLAVEQVTFCALQQGDTHTIAVDPAWTATWRRQAVLVVSGLLVDREYGARPGPGCVDCASRADCPAA